MGITFIKEASESEMPVLKCGRHGGLMVSVLDSGASASGSSPGPGLMGKTLYSHSASLHAGV